MKHLWMSVAALLLVGSVLLVVAQEDAAAESANWYNEATWYLLFVRSFNDSDGDGVGDFQGIIERLDYLNDGDPTTTDDLGIGAIWLMPVAEAVSYHGYDTIDYRAIEEDYGTEEDFRALLDAAHERGIRVVVDFVANHTSDAHPWFEASEAQDDEFSDWYIWEATDPNIDGPWGEEAWYDNNERDAYYYAPFWSRMPDLNHQNPDVTDEIYDIARYWIEDLGVDGFRLDAIKYWVEAEVEGRLLLEDSPANRAYVAAFTDYVHSLNPDAVTIGEVFDTTLVVSRYTDDDSADLLFEFDTAADMISAAQLGNKRNIEGQIGNNLYSYDDMTEIATFLSNHDQARLLTQLEGDIGMNKTAASLLLTLPGTPFIYYGEEIGMTGNKPDELIRRPMQWNDSAGAGFTAGDPWQPLADDYAERTVAAQTDDPDSLLSHYRNLVHLRNAHPALQVGATIELESSYRSAYAFIRTTDEETLLVLHNLDDRESREYTLDLEDSPLSNFNSGEIIFGTHPVDEMTLTLPDVSDAGGFSEYVPLPAPLPPHSTFVIRLS